MRIGGFKHSMAVSVAAACLIGTAMQASGSETIDHAYGKCVATGSSSVIDDMEDGDARIATNEGRLGVWYIFNPGGDCQQQPVVTKQQRFKMAADNSNGEKFVAATKGRNCKANGWSGGGIGIEFLAEDIDLQTDPIRCAGGYDAGPYRGLSFAVKSQANVRVQVCTTDITDFNCHGYDITAKGDGWRNITIPWSQLLQEDWGPSTKKVEFNPKHLMSIQFKALSSEFALAIDNLQFLKESGGGDGGGTGRWFGYKPQDMYPEQIKTEYENWKAKYLVSCSDGSADVRKNGDEAVSEGTGYAMLMAVSLNDRLTFDQLSKAFLQRRNPRGMMSWRFSVCGGIRDQSAATDGDLDIAMALVLADRKWGSYRSHAESLITALKQYGTSNCNGLQVLRPGDNWGGCNDSVDQRLNPSYFAPGYYHSFAAYLPNQADFWNTLADDSYKLLKVYQGAMGGLLPDWSYANGSLAGGYGYEACRVPWRIGTDFAWHGHPEAAMVLDGIFDYANVRGGPAAVTDQKNSCFVGGFALSSIGQSQDAANNWYRTWIANIPQSPDSNVGDNPYYQGTLRVLYLLLMSGMLHP